MLKGIREFIQGEKKLDPQNIYLVEFNPSNLEFHIQDVQTTIEENMTNITFVEAFEFESHFLIVAIAESEEEARQKAKDLEKDFDDKLKQQIQSRGFPLDLIYGNDE